MTALYNITAEYLNNVCLLESMDFDEETKQDTLESLQGDFENKAISICFVKKELEAQSNAIGEAIKEMQARKDALDKKGEHLKEYLLSAMQQTGIKKISCPYFDVQIKNNPAKVEIFEQGLIPSEFMRQPEPPPPAPDKKAIKAAIESGQEVQGARIVNTQRLEIK